MHFRVNKSIIIIFTLLLFNLQLYSADSGFVVNSPMYLNESTLVSTKQETFNEQLGLSLGEKEVDPQYMLLRAISDSNYPITPGDSFKVDYLERGEKKQILLQVDSNYRVNIPLINTIDAEGMVLNQLVESISNSISTYYPFSSPQVSLVSIGVFAVKVIGEVTSSATITVNGLTRLSEVVGVASRYANTREIQIKSKSGKVKTYDLYLALKKGQVNQDPLLKVGDTVILKQADKLVSITGDVYKEGSYQPKNDETLSDIISYYSGGLLSSADKNNILISRYSRENNEYNQIKTTYDSDIVINHLDKIVVPSIKIVKDSITVEGAIRDESTNSSTTASLLGMSRGSLVYNFFPGETLKELLETISPRFISTSDLSNSYIVRGDKTISVDIHSYITQDREDEFILQPGDKLVVPFKQKFVNVQGAVQRSNAYAYEPNKKISYYISLAGGLSQNATNEIKITDSYGNKLNTDSFVPAEATIYVKESTFQKDLATTTSILTIIASVLAIINTTLQITGVK